MMHVRILCSNNLRKMPNLYVYEIIYFLPQYATNSKLLKISYSKFDAINASKFKNNEASKNCL